MFNRQGLNENLENLFYGDLSTLQNLIDLCDEVEAQSSNQTLCPNTEENAKTIGNSFKSVKLLLDNHFYNDANIVLNSIYERLNASAYFHEVLEVARRYDTRRTLEIEISSNPTQNFTMLYNKFCGLFALFSAVSKKSYDLSSDLSRDLDVNMAEALPHIPVVGMETSSEETRDSSSNEETTNREESTQVYRNTVQYYQNKITDIMNLLRSVQVKDQEEIPSFLITIKEELGESSRNFLDFVNNTEIDVFNINEIFTTNMNYQKIYFFVNRALQNNTEKETLVSNFEELETKVAQSQTYPFENGQGFVKSVELTYHMLK